MSVDRLEQGYYGRPILKPPVWKPDIAWYLFAAAWPAPRRRWPDRARLPGTAVWRAASTLWRPPAFAASPALLVYDLGRPERFVNMLRVFKPTSPMNLGSWLLAAAGRLRAAALACDVSGRLPRVGPLAG